MSAFTQLCSDTDCDGTSYCARRIFAPNLSAAERVHDTGSYSLTIESVIPEEKFLADFELYYALPISEGSRWNPREYYLSEGYVSLGNTWS